MEAWVEDREPLDKQNHHAIRCCDEPYRQKIAIATFYGWKQTAMRRSTDGGWSRNLLALVPRPGFEKPSA